MTVGPEPPPGEEQAISCATCGRIARSDEAGQARLRWSRAVENGRIVWSCETCTRVHARAIEGRLDSAWW